MTSAIGIEMRKPDRAIVSFSLSAMSALKFPSSLSRIMCKFARTNTHTRGTLAAGRLQRHHLQFAVVLVAERANRVTRLFHGQSIYA